MLSQKIRKNLLFPPFFLALTWIGEFFSFGIYYFVVYLITSKPRDAAESGHQTTVMLLSVAAAVFAFAGLMFKRYIFSQKRARNFLSHAQSQGQSANAPPGGTTPVEESILVLAKRTIPLYFVSLGLINTCCLLGMIAAILTHNKNIFIPFLMVSTVGLALCYPKFDSFLEESMMNRQQSFKTE